MAKQKKENRWYHEKSTLTVFLVLRFLVILTAILSAVRRDYESVFISCFTLLLFLLPNILTKRLRVTLPSTLECIILLFVFAANILGEINNFYGGFSESGGALFYSIISPLSCCRCILFFYDSGGLLGNL